MSGSEVTGTGTEEEPVDAGVVAPTEPPEAGADEPRPEPDPEDEAGSGAEPEDEAGSGAEPEPEDGSGLVLDPAPAPASEPPAGPEPESDDEPEAPAEPAHEAEAESAPDLETRPEPDPGPETTEETEPEEEPAPGPAPAPEVEPEAAPAAEVEPEVEVEPEPEVEVEAAQPSRAAWLHATVLVALALGGVALRLALALPEGGPILAADAAAYLGNARWLAGTSRPDLSGIPYYGFGYSVLLAPFYAAGLGPSQVVVAAQTINALAGAAVALPLGALLGRAWPGLGPRAWWAAVAASLTPALVLQPAYVWPETLVALLFAAWCLLVLRLLRDDRAGDAVALALVAVALWATHQRTAGVVALTAAVLVVAAVRARPHHRLLAERVGGVVVLVVGFAVVQAVTARLVDAVWRGDTASGAERTGRMLDRLSGDEVGELLANLLGQTWYVAVSSAGLALVGAVVVVGRSWPLLRRPRHGGRVEGLPWAVVLGGVLAVLATGVVFTDGVRIDQALYGRYNELWIPVLTALGIGWLAAQRRLVRLGGGAAAAAAVAVLGGWLAASWPSGRVSGQLVPMNVIGVVGPQVLVDGAPEPFVGAIEVATLGLLAAGAALGLTVAGVLRAELAAVAAGALFVGTSVVGHTDSLARFRSITADHYRVVAEAVEETRLPDGVRIAYDTSTPSPHARRMMEFWLGDERLRDVGSAEEAVADGSRLVLSRDEVLAERCYERLAVQTVGSVELWQRDDDCLRRTAAPAPDGAAAELAPAEPS